MQIHNRKLYYLGIIVFIIGLITTIHGVTLNTMGQPLNIQVYPGHNYWYQINIPNEIIIDFTNSTFYPSNTWLAKMDNIEIIQDMANNEQPYGKCLTYNNYCYTFIALEISIRDNLIIRQIPPNKPLFTAPLNTVRQIIIQPNNRVITIRYMNNTETNIQLPYPLKPNRIHAYFSPQTLKGTIHIYGGYIIGEYKPYHTITQTTTPRHTGPVNPPVITTHPITTTTPTSLTQPNKIIELIDHNGPTLMAIGIAIIIIAIL